MINKFVRLQNNYVFINMEKYRSLTTAELIEFEKEFISFLVVNGIEATEWEQIKQTEPKKAEAIVAQFSDVIFESIFRKTMFLEHISSKSIKCFQCLKDEFVLVGLDANADSDINFIGEQPIESIIINNTKSLQIYQTKKKYTKTREKEMFDLMEIGAKLSKGDLFKHISLLL